MKRLLFFLMAIVFAIQGWSQTTITVNGTSATSTGIPWSSTSHHTFCQMIYTAAEIKAANGNVNPTPMTISSMAWKWTGANPTTRKGFHVMIGTTTSTGFPFFGATYITPTNNTEVYYVLEQEFSNATEWTTMNFQRPFTWNGTANIVVTVISSYDKLSAVEHSADNFAKYTGSVARYTEGDGSGIDPSQSPYSTSTAALPTTATENAVKQAVQFGFFNATCLSPLSVRAINVTAFTADIVKTNPATTTATQWNLQYKLPTQDWSQAVSSFISSDTFSISGLTAETKYDIRMRAICGAGDTSNWSAPASFVTTPTCIQPNGLAMLAATLRTDSAIVVWNERDLAQEYILQYKESSIANWNDASVVQNSVTDTFFVMENLNANTAYNVRIRSVCTATDSSYWTTAINFMTKCNPQALPYPENFDSYSDFPNCWSRYVGSAVSTTNPSLSTASASSAPNAIAFNSNDATLVSPYFVDDVNTMKITFRSSRTNEWSGHLSIGYFANDNDMSSFVPVAYSDSSSNQWKYHNILLGSIPAGVKRFAFRQNRNVVSSNHYLDDIVVTQAPACPDVYDLTTSVISHTQIQMQWRDMASDMEIVYGLAAFDTANSTTYNSVIVPASTVLPYILDSLQPNTAYKLAFRHTCDNDEHGAWSDIIYLSTFVTPDTLPYQTGFDIATENATWRLVNGAEASVFYIGAGLDPLSTTGGYAVPDGNDGTTVTEDTNSLFISSDNGTTNIKVSNTSSSVYAYKDFAVPANASELSLSFDYRCLKAGSGSATDYGNSILARVYFVPVNVAINENVAISDTYLIGNYTGGAGDYRLGDLTNPVWHHINMPITETQYTNLAGNTWRLVILYKNAYSSTAAQPPLAVDNLSLDVFTCASPSNIATSNIQSTAIDIAWATSSATKYYIQYAPADSSWATALEDSTTTNSYTITSLIPQTNYKLRLKAVCSVGNESGWSYTFPFTTGCAEISTFPYRENFDTLVGNTLPTCWSKLPATTLRPSASDNFGAYSSKALQFTCNYDAPFYNIAILPRIDNSIDISTLRISFKVRADNWGTNIPLVTGTMTDPTDVNTFVGFDTITPTPAQEWINKIISFDSTVGAGQYIAFKAYGTGLAASSVYIDDVVLAEVSDCPNVSDFSVVRHSPTSVKVSWDTSDVQSWILVWDATTPDLFDPSTATSSQLVSQTDMPYIISGLVEGADYSFAMMPSCGVEWSETASVYMPTFVDVPFVRSFDSLSDGNDFVFANGATNGWVVGAATGNPANSMYVSNDNGVSNDYTASASDSLISATLNVSFGSDLYSELRFDWKANGNANDFGRVYIMPLDAELTDSSAVQLGGDLNMDISWQHALFVFDSTYSNTHKKIVFTWQSTSSTANNPAIAIDNINIVANNCLPPHNISTVANATNPNAVDVSFTPANGGDTAWYVYYRTALSNTYDSVLTTTPSVTIPNINASTTYYIRVATACGYSFNYSLERTYVSPCGIVSLPWTEDFEGTPGWNVNILPACWLAYCNNAPANRGPGVGGTYPYLLNEVFLQNPHQAHSGIQTVYFVDLVDNPTLVSPQFDTIIDVLKVNFWLRGEGLYHDTLILNQDTIIANPTFAVGYYSNLADLTSFVPLETFLVDSAHQRQWINYDVSLRGSKDKNIKHIAFRLIEDASIPYHLGAPNCDHMGGDEAFQLDDIRVDYAAACAPVTNLALAGMAGQTTATISWSSSPTAANYQVKTNFGSVAPITLPDSLTNYTFTGLTPSTIYWLYLRSNCGQGSASDWDSVQITTAAIPVVQTDTALVNTSTCNQVALNGTITIVATAIEAGFVYSTTANPAAGEVGSIIVPASTTLMDGSPFSFAVTGLSYGTTYYYRAYAKEASGSYFYGAQRVFATCEIPPTVVTTAATSISTVDATLNATVTEGTESIVSRGFKYRTGNDSWTDVSAIGTTTINYALTGLVACTTYQFFAYATTASFTVTGDTLTFSTLATPTSITTNPATDITATGATLNSTILAGCDTIVSGYKYRAGNSGVFITDTAGILTGLTASTQYFFFAYITTVSVGEICGDTLSFTTSEYVGDPPVITTDSAVLANECRDITFYGSVESLGTPAADVFGFIYGTTTPLTNGTEVAGTISGTAMTATATGLTINTSYYYKAFAKVGTDYFYGEEKAIVTCNSLSELEANGVAINLYPNPANSTATLSVEGLRDDAQITVTDLTGKVIAKTVIKSNQSTLTIDVKSYAAGIYYIRVLNNDINRTQKLIVNK